MSRTPPPFGLSPSKARDLSRWPFDKLRVDGQKEGGDGAAFTSRTPQPFGLSLSKAKDLSSGPFDKLRVNGLEAIGPSRPNRSA